MFKSIRLHYKKPLVSDEIRAALNSRSRPVVALESTIITHGFPFPENLDMAHKVEAAVREKGCIPATCAYIKGQGYVGLLPSQLAYLAEQKNVNKVSRRDFGPTIAQRLDGGTTIAGTMIMAHHAGIKVFGTGGLGGVHREGHISMDVSADLTELSRTPVAVVCAGPKRILDIARTMEFLETQGVYVGTLSQTGKADVPGFYCAESGVPSPYTFDSFKAAAEIIHAQNLMGLPSGIFCIPPPEHSSLPSTFVDDIIERATREAYEKGISGKHLTPFLLAYIAKETNGRSVLCNLELVLNNVKAACDIATELLKIERGETGSPNHEETKPTFTPDLVKADRAKTTLPVSTLVVGLVALDTVAKISTTNMGDSNPGSLATSVGGVGYNVFKALNYSLESQQLQEKTGFLSVVGNDFPGSVIQQSVSGLLVTEGVKTAQYTAVVDLNGELVVACADMGIFECPKTASSFEAELKSHKAKRIVVDCNLSPAALDSVLSAEGDIIVEPTSKAKLARLGQLHSSNLKVFPENRISMVTPTVAELDGIFTSFSRRDLFDDYDDWFPLVDSLGIDAHFRETLERSDIAHLLKNGALQQCFQILPYIPFLVVKLGPRGVVVVRLCTNVNSYKSLPTSKHKPMTFVSHGAKSKDQLGVIIHHFPAPNQKLDIVNVSGAGDSLLGYLVATLSKENWLKTRVESAEQEWALWEAFHKAQIASGLSLQYEGTISPRIATL